MSCETDGACVALPRFVRQNTENSDEADSLRGRRRYEFEAAEGVSRSLLYPIDYVVSGLLPSILFMYVRNDINTEAVDC